MSKEFGSMPLTWTKLGEYNDVSDIYLCDQIVAVMRFDAKSNKWTGSDLQRWLNCEFYRQAFTDEQRKQIVGNETTHDCVFILSVEEFNRFNSHIKIIELPWWLRSPGSYANYAALVDDYGDVDGGGDDVDGGSIGVRPAILLRKKAK